jgi:NAD(P)-dependent dehydrogenase (short-subunit alcohol dehydrogenase family)
MLAQVLACELGEPNIQVNLLVHGPVQIRVSRALWQDAELMARYEATVPLRRVGKPEDVAGETLSLASSAADWVTGGVLVVEGVATPVSVV